MENAPPAGGGSHGVAAWSSEAWRSAATAWLDARLAERGVRRTGEVEQPHLRPWATALRAPTSAGVVWLKAPGPGTAFEVALYPLLYAAAPDRVLEPLAVDPERAWLLLPDGGQPLGELTPEPAVLRAFEELLPAYGQLQRDLAPHADALLGAGVPDLRPEAAPAVFAEQRALAGEGVACRGDPAEQEEYTALAGLEPAVTAWSERLAASAVAPSIDHNDLHPWNVLLPAGVAAPGAGRVYDWGDAVVGHPFASALVVLRWAVGARGEGPGGLGVRRLRDAYLSAFTDVAPPAELVAELEAACRLGMIGRALSWNRALRASGEHLTGELASASVAWLANLRCANHLGL